MSYKLVIVLARFLEPKQKNNELLAPVRCLHEIVRLQFWSHVPMGIV